MSDLATNGGHLVLKDGHLLKGACTCCDKWCCYTWESVWNPTTNTWSTPVVIATECKLKPVVLYTWVHTADPCVAHWIDAPMNCTDVSTRTGDVGGANAPTGVPSWTPTGCVNPCGLDCSILPASLTVNASGTVIEYPPACSFTPTTTVTPLSPVVVTKTSPCTWEGGGGTGLCYMRVQLNASCGWDLFVCGTLIQTSKGGASPIGSYPDGAGYLNEVENCPGPGAGGPGGYRGYISYYSGVSVSA